MTAPDTYLAIALGLTSVALVTHRLYSGTRRKTDPYLVANVAVAVVAGILAYVGLYDTLNSIMTPVTDALVRAVGVPVRWETPVGMPTGQYAPTDILRVLVVLPVFLYASYRDIKERLVRNWVWYPIFAYGLVLLCYDLYAGTLSFLAPWAIGNVLFATVVGVFLFKTHIFGGADMKAVWGLGLLFPTYPALVVAPRVLPPVLAAPQNVMNLFALTILANTALVAMVWPVYTFIKNVHNGTSQLHRPGLMFTAERVSLDDAFDNHGRILPVWAFESAGPLSRLKTLIMFVVNGLDTKSVQDYIGWHNETADEPISKPSQIETPYVEQFLNSEFNRDDDGEQIWETDDREQAVTVFETLLTRDTVWMTPGIPFIVPMFIGLLLSLLVGDIMYWLIVGIN
jgi:preflagellin peptidase FlaK